MIKRFIKNKLIKLLVLLLVVLMLYLFPNDNEYKLKDKKIIDENIYHELYLLDKNNLLAKTKVVVNSINKKDLIKELIETLEIDGKYTDRIPNGFTPILSNELIINNISFDSNTITLDFNDKLFDSKYNEETILESLIYTLTSIKNVNGIRISINNKKLTNLPKSNKQLDDILTRSYGINKEYNINSIKDITSVTVYYNNKFNNDIYYVPVTKYINSNDNKIKIIIDQLTSRNTYNSNLISYINTNSQLLNYSFNEEELNLNFNEYLFDNKEDKTVLEEVIYSILYSINDTLNIKEVNFFVNNEKINIKK